MKTLNTYKFTYFFVFLLVIVACDNSVTPPIEKHSDIELSKFTNDDTFKELMSEIEEFVETQSKDFRSLSDIEKSIYQKRIIKYSRALNLRPSKENLDKFTNHIGFPNTNEFIRFYNNQKLKLNKLMEKYPTIKELDSAGKKKLFTNAALKYYEESLLGKSSSNCSQILEAEKTRILGIAVGAVLACGATSAGLSTIITPIGGGAFYGACVGAVYATMNAELELAELEFQECIADMK